MTAFEALLSTFYDRFLNISYTDSSNLSNGTNSSILTKSNVRVYDLTPFGAEFISVIYLTMSFIGLCGNTLLIYIICRIPRLQTATNQYILNLAIIDVSIIFSKMLFSLKPSLACSYILHDRCKIYMYLTLTNKIIRSLLISAMSINWCLVILYPKRVSRRRAVLYARIVCFRIWFLSVFLAVPIFIYEDFLKDAGKLTCNIFLPEYAYMNQYMWNTIFNFTLVYAFIDLLLLACFILIILKFLKDACNGIKHFNRKGNSLVPNLVTFHVLFWLPNWYGQFLMLYMSMDPRSYASNFGLILLAEMYAFYVSAINPILCMLFSRNFWTNITSVVCCVPIEVVNTASKVIHSPQPIEMKELTSVVIKNESDISHTK